MTGLTARGGVSPSPANVARTPDHQARFIANPQLGVVRAREGL